MSFKDKQDFLDRVRTRLALPQAHFELDLRPRGDVFDGNGGIIELAQMRPAAVLMGLIDRGDDFGVFLTERPKTMKAHAGQVAFPGGKIDLGDANAAAAALREAEEEIGVPARAVELLGQAPPYRTRSGFIVSLFVGLLPYDFEPEPCPYEVEDVFETPLSFLMHPDNHEEHEREWNGVLRRYYAMPHNGRKIWGITAGMIKSLYDVLYGEGDARASVWSE